MQLIAGLDIEATGLEQEKGHRMVEVALGILDLEAPEPRSVRWVVQRLNPERPIDPKAFEVHGIAFEDLTTCPTWEQWGPLFARVLHRIPVLVAHNGEGFDLPFVWRELIRIGQAPPTIRLVDTMLQGRWATPDGSVPNLGALAFACGVDYDKEKAHAASYDVDVMLQCFTKQLPRGFFTIPAQPFDLNEQLKKAA
jgi:DNA polymerase-3 subunit epsilon